MYACPYDPLLQLLPTFHSVANLSKVHTPGLGFVIVIIWLCKVSYPNRKDGWISWIFLAPYLHFNIRLIGFFLNKYKNTQSCLNTYVLPMYYIIIIATYSTTTSKSCTDVFFLSKREEGARSIQKFWISFALKQ